MARSDSTDGAAARNDALDRLVGFDVNGVVTRIGAALKTERRKKRRAALEEVSERLRNLQRSRGPEHVAAADFLMAASRAEATLKPLMLSAAARVAAAERNDGARLGSTETPEGQILRGVAKGAFELLQLLAEAKGRTLAWSGDSLPRTDEKSAGRPKLAFLGGIELTLRQGGFGDAEIDKLVLRAFSGKPRPTAEMRKAAFDAITKRIRRANDAHEAAARQEQEDLERWFRLSPGNREAFESLGNSERQNPI